MMNNSIRSRVSDHNPFDLRNVTIPNSVDEVSQHGRVLCVVACHRVQRDSAVRDPVFSCDDGQRHVAHRAGEDGGK